MVATHCAVMCGLFVHALRCALLLVSLVFVELFFGESPSLHYLFLHFLAKCFFCNFIYSEPLEYRVPKIRTLPHKRFTFRIN